MNCYLCNEEIGSLEKDELTCPFHKSPVIHKYGALSKELIHVIFYVVFKNESYQVILKPREQRSEINKVNYFRTDLGNSFEMPTLVQKFEHLISITPENAADKIPTILTFS